MHEREYQNPLFDGVRRELDKALSTTFNGPLYEAFAYASTLVQAKRLIDGDTEITEVSYKVTQRAEEK